MKTVVNSNIHTHRQISASRCPTHIQHGCGQLRPHTLPHTYNMSVVSWDKCFYVHEILDTQKLTLVTKSMCQVVLLGILRCLEVKQKRQKGHQTVPILSTFSLSSVTFRIKERENMFVS